MKKKHHHHKKGRRNSSSGGSALASSRLRGAMPIPRPRAPRRAPPPTWKAIAAAAAGSVGSAVASGLIVNQKIASPETISLLMAATTGVGAYLTDGNARVAFMGAAAAGTGQLALAYLGKAAMRAQEHQTTAPPAAPAPPPPQLPAPAPPAEPPRKSATGGGVVVDLFRDAATDLEMLHEDQWRYGMRGDRDAEFREGDYRDAEPVVIDLDHAA